MNFSFNNTQNVSEPSPKSAPVVAAMLLIGVFVCATNGMVIVVFFLSPRIRSCVNIFVLNLAFVDLQNGLISIPLTAFYDRSSPALITPSRYNMTVGLCNLITNWPTVLVTTSFLSVALISVDRCIAIFSPFRYTEIVTRTRAAASIALVWLWAILVTFYPTFGWEVVADTPYYYGCDRYYKHTTDYVTFWAIGVIGVSLVVVLTAYCIMYTIARRHIAEIRKLAVTSSDQARAHGASTKAAKTTFVMTSLYIVCWVPFIVSIMTASACTITTCTGLLHAYAHQSTKVTASCAFIQTGLNPIIYSLRTSEIRDFLRKKCCCNRKITNIVSVKARDHSETDVTMCDLN